MSTREGHSFFKGARVSLGPVALKNRPFEEFSNYELAYIIGRYINQNADSGMYWGSIKSILKRLWPDDYESVTDKQMRGIYKVLRILGFRSGQSPTGDFWRTSDDVDKNYVDRTIVIEKKPPEPVKYRCAFCDERFDKSDDLKSHIASTHARREERTDMSDALKAQVLPNRQEIMVRCKACGEEVTARGLGGHMQGHRVSKEMVRLLDAIAERPGLHPRDYAEVLNKTGSATSGVGRALVKRGLVQTTGNRQSARYFPKDWNTEQIQTRFSELTNGKKPTPTPVRQQRRSVEKNASPNVGAGVAPEIRPAYILVIGDREYVVDGDNVRPL